MDNVKNEQNIRILIVDDVEVNLLILEQIIVNMGYTALKALSVGQAMEYLQNEDELPQIILSDISMPEVDGFDFCTMLKKNPYTRDIPVIFISAMDMSEDRSKGFELGAVDYIIKPFDQTEVELRINNHLKIYMLQKELEESNHRLSLVVTRQMEKMRIEQKNIMLALARLVEYKEAQGVPGEPDACHYFNIPYNSRILAQGMQFSPRFEEEIDDNFIETIEFSSALHDIGKIRIPDYVLLKTTELTEEERELVNTHTTLGAKTLEDIYEGAQRNDFINMAIDIARYHHENWDGTGYPDGLKGREIPLAARIVKVIDVYDVMMNERSYKHKISKEETLKWMSQRSGTHFDPDIMAVFMKIHRNLITDGKPFGTVI